jgi:hypothetical protein
MKVEIPFSYIVDYKQPAKPSWSSSSIRDTTVLDFETIDADDAPVVHILSDSAPPTLPRYFQRSYGDANDGGIAAKFHVKDDDCVVRQFAGQYYASRFPVGDLAANRGEVCDPLAAIVSVAGHMEHRGVISTGLDEESITIAEFQSKEGNVKRFTSNRKVWDQCFHVMAGNFAVIDGVLYEKVAEPVLVAIVHPAAKKVMLHIEEKFSPAGAVFYKGGWRGTPSIRVRFGLDELERALAYCTGKAAEFGGEFVSHARIESVSTDHVRFRGDGEFLFGAAAEALKVLSAKMASLPNDLALAVSDLRYTMAVHDRLTPAALASIGRLDSFLAEHGDAVPNDQAVARFREALAHWQERSSFGMEWIEGSVDAVPGFHHPKRAFEVTSLSDIDALIARWQGGEPRGLGDFDPDVSRLVMVEDFQTGLPLSAFVFDRFAPDAQPAVHVSGDKELDTLDLAMAKTYVDADQARLRSEFQSSLATATP